MKIIISVLLLFVSSISFGQKDFNHRIEVSMGILGNFQIERGVGLQWAYPPVFNLNYYERRGKFSYWKTGIGLTVQGFRSNYLDAYYPNAVFTDWNAYLKIPFQYHYEPKPWYYLSGGLNAKIKFKSNTYPIQISHNQYIDHNTGRPTLLEATGNTGIQFSIWRLTFKLGVFSEVPLIYREYINFGADMNVLFSF